jgi:hypothetical protein
MKWLDFDTVRPDLVASLSQVAGWTAAQCRCIHFNHSNLVQKMKRSTTFFEEKSMNSLVINHSCLNKRILLSYSNTFHNAHFVNFHFCFSDKVINNFSRSIALSFYRLQFKVCHNTL